MWLSTASVPGNILDFQALGLMTEKSLQNEFEEY
jgi:hypothetical protein